MQIDNTFIFTGNHTKTPKLFLFKANAISPSKLDNKTTIEALHL